jgi:hypothetical protein
MKQLNLSEITMVSGGVGGGVKPPENPPRGAEAQSIEINGSYTPPPPPPPKTEEGN